MAVVGANLVLLGYILTAFADFDGDEVSEAGGEEISSPKKRKNE